MIKVLIVDDSIVVQEFLKHIFSSDPAIQVMGVANNGEEAVEIVRQQQPDVITMDIHMPKMNGLETTRRIMEIFPTPIVIVSSINNSQEAAYTFKLLEAGALAVMLRPLAFDHPGNKTAVDDLIRMVKMMSEVKVVGRSRNTSNRNRVDGIKKTSIAVVGIKLIVIGASIGGPQALQKLISRLPLDLTVPILIVQHIAVGFVEGFADWLGGSVLLPVHVATQGVLPLPGHCYIAPDGFHMGLGSDLTIVLKKEEPKIGHLPSVAHLFHSVAEVLGSQVIGVLLTGMGRDGASELKDKGAVTFAQNEESSIVYGMPGEAVKLNAATYILTPEEIAESLAILVKKH